MTATCVNCGGAACLCIVAGTGLLSTTGAGTEEDPILFHLSCDDVVACVGAMMTDIGFTTGMLATGAVGEHLEADDVTGHAVWVAAGPCVPGVMGSVRWGPTEWPDEMLTYDAGGAFYYSGVLQNDEMIWPDYFVGTQSIEATISNFGTSFQPGPEDGGTLDGAGNPWISNDYIGLVCRRGGTVHLGDGLGIYFHRYPQSATTTPDPERWEWWVDYEEANVSLYYDESSPRWAAWPYGETFQLRLESDANGDYRVYVDDALLTSGNVPGMAVTPSLFSVYCDAGSGVYSNTALVPHIANICMIGEAAG